MRSTWLATWSHAIDDGNEEGASYNISNTFNNATVPGNYSFDKGTSSLDQRHRVSVNWVWNSKFTSKTDMFSRNFINGWNLSSITTLGSSHPATTTIGSASTSTGGVFTGVALANSTINGSGGWNRVPFLPVGNLNIDQVYNVDLRLGHTYSFGERLKATLSFEAFNAFNTIHNTGIGDAGLYGKRGRHPPSCRAISAWAICSAGFPDGNQCAALPGQCFASNF